MTWPFQLPPQVVCWVRGHAPLLEQRRDATGALVWPPVRAWICARCRRDLGATVLRVDRPPAEDREVWR